MFIIRNNTNGKIMFKDFSNLKLDIGQEIDLSARFSYITIKSSPQLKNAVEKNLVSIVKNDFEPEVKKEENTNTNIDDLKQLIKDELSKKTVSSDELSNKMDMILNLLNSKGINNLPSSNSAENTKEQENSLEDEKRISEIHKRSVSRITKNTDGNVNSQSEIKNVDISTDELEGLL